MSLNQDSYLILPGTTTFQDLDSKISYDTTEENEVAEIRYYYHGAYLGTATVDLAQKASVTYEFPEEAESLNKKNIVVVNVKIILLVILAVAVVLIAIIIIYSIASSYNIMDYKKGSKKRSLLRRKRKRNRKDGPHFPSSRFNGFDL